MNIDRTMELVDRCDDFLRQLPSVGAREEFVDVLYESVKATEEEFGYLVGRLVERLESGAYNER